SSRTTPSTSTPTPRCDVEFLPARTDRVALLVESQTDASLFVLFVPTQSLSGWYHNVHCLQVALPDYFFPTAKSDKKKRIDHKETQVKVHSGSLHMYCYPKLA